MDSKKLQTPVADVAEEKIDTTSVTKGKKVEEEYEDDDEPTSFSFTIEQEIIEMVLLRKYFYSHFLQQFRRHAITAKDPRAKTIRTLGVNITDDLRPNLFVNMNFYNSLTKDEKMGVLEHEVLHMLHKHLIRKEEREDYVWNLAADIAINQYIKGLPKGIMCGECAVIIRKEDTTDPKTGKVTGFVYMYHKMDSDGEKQITIKGSDAVHCPCCGKEVDNKVDRCEPMMWDKFPLENGTKLQAEMTTENYYDVLWKNMPKQVIKIGMRITKDGQAGAGRCLGEGGEDSSDGHGKGYGNGWVEIDGQKVPIVMDDHDAWSTCSDNKELAHEKIKDMVQKAVNESSNRSQGHLPSYLKSLIDSCIAHKILNWRSEMRKFVGYEEFAKLETTRKRRNRRYDFQPGYKIVRKAHVAVCVDSSGSVTDNEFAKFFSEIEAMKKAGVSITVIECDADIQDVYTYKKTPKIKRIGYGGTDFRPPFDLITNGKFKQGEGGYYSGRSKGREFEIKKKVDCIIYCTDMAGSFPRTIPCPTIWVATPQHSDYGWKPELGKKVVMRD